MPGTPTQTVTFDGGTSGSAVAVSGSVTGVATAVYNSADTVHGSMGARIGGANGAHVEVTLGTTGTHSGSVYVTPRSISTSAQAAVSFRTSAGAIIGQVRLHSDGHFDLANSATRITGAGVSTITWTANTTYRIDYQFDQTTTASPVVTARIFTTIEGTTQADSITGTMSATAACAKLWYGYHTGATGLTTGFDTLRLYEGTLVWADPFGTPPPPAAGTVNHHWVGAPTASGFSVVSYTSACTSTQLQVATDSGFTSIVTTTSAQVPDATSGLVRHNPTGLSANTAYYYRMLDTPSGGSATVIGEVGRSHTLPGTGAQNFTFAFGGCVTNNADAHLTLDDIRAWAPTFMLHMGDFHYYNPTSTVAADHVALWEAQIAGAAGYHNLVRDVPMFYIRSDHDAGPGDNADSNVASNQASIDGYKQIVPYPTLADTRSPTVGLYFAYTVGRVRFIHVDIRNMDRTAGLTADSSTKTMLGATQEAWLEGELARSEFVKVIVSDVAWSGPYSTANGEDKWWSYDNARQLLAAAVHRNAANVLMLTSDTHSMLGDDGGNNAWGGWPIFGSAPMANVGGGRNLTYYQNIYNTTSSVVGNQYGRVTVVDDGTNVTLTMSAWDALNGVERFSQAVQFVPTNASVAGTAASSGTATVSLSDSGTAVSSGADTLRASVSAAALASSTATVADTVSGAGSAAATAAVGDTLTGSAAASSVSQVHLVAAGMSTAAGTANAGSSATVAGSATSSGTAAVALADVGSATSSATTSPRLTGSGTATSSGTGSLVLAGPGAAVSASTDRAVLGVGGAATSGSVTTVGGVTPGAAIAAGTGQLRLAAAGAAVATGLAAQQLAGVLAGSATATGTATVSLSVMPGSTSLAAGSPTIGAVGTGQQSSAAGLWLLNALPNPSGEAGGTNWAQAQTTAIQGATDWFVDGAGATEVTVGATPNTTSTYAYPQLQAAGDQVSNGHSRYAAVPGDTFDWVFTVRSAPTNPGVITVRPRMIGYWFNGVTETGSAGFPLTIFGDPGGLQLQPGEVNYFAGQVTVPSATDPVDGILVLPYLMGVDISHPADVGAVVSFDRGMLVRNAPRPLTPLDYVDGDQATYGDWNGTQYKSSSTGLAESPTIAAGATGAATSTGQAVVGAVGVTGSAATTGTTALALSATGTAASTGTTGLATAGPGSAASSGTDRVGAIGAGTAASSSVGQLGLAASGSVVSLGTPTSGARLAGLAASSAVDTLAALVNGAALATGNVFQTGTGNVNGAAVADSQTVVWLTAPGVLDDPTSLDQVGAVVEGKATADGRPASDLAQPIVTVIVNGIEYPCSVSTVYPDGTELPAATLHVV